MEQARKEQAGEAGVRRSQDAAYSFMLATSGDRVGFEEALRALYAGDRDHFAEQIEAWPEDVRAHALDLAAGAWTGSATAS